jgi:hypothetical protein
MDPDYANYASIRTDASHTVDAANSTILPTATVSFADDCVSKHLGVELVHRKVRNTSLVPDSFLSWLFYFIFIQTSIYCLKYLLAQLVMGVLPALWGFASAAPVPKLPVLLSISDFRPRSVAFPSVLYRSENGFT